MNPIFNRTTVRLVAEIVSDMSGIALADLVGTCRRQEHVYWRYLAFFILTASEPEGGFDFPLNRTGEYWPSKGGADHSTVIRGREQIRTALSLGGQKAGLTRMAVKRVRRELYVRLEKYPTLTASAHA